MDNNKKMKQFNKKLLVVFLTMLAIFATLLVARVQAMNVPAEIASEDESKIGRPQNTYFTYEDLQDYYDILCCQHHYPLPGNGGVTLSGTHCGKTFSYNMGKWQDLGYTVGSKIENHTIYRQIQDFDATSYVHKTYGYYNLVEKHIASPKEAYIIAEMKEEKASYATPSSSATMLTDGASAMVYTGSLINSISQKLSTGETVYTVNQRYVLNTSSGAFYVKTAVDSDGNMYYVYETNPDGSLVAYTGDYTYKNPQTGTSVPCEGVSQSNVYYEFGGTISSGTKAPNSGTMYLVEYDRVLEKDGTLYYCEVTDSDSYIQIAWWTTPLGTSYGKVLPDVTNSLAKEAEAFENYILNITGKSSVSELTYAEQSYNIIEPDGTATLDSVQAPVIEYDPAFNMDADQNGVENEADEVTIGFDHNKQTYVIGPFSLDYVKESATISGRSKIDFAYITNATLKTNLGELERGKDWNFKFLADQPRDPDYEYPNPNEVFYIEINYKEGLTEITDFKFDFKYMNAGAEVDYYKGFYNKVTWTVKNKDKKELAVDSAGNAYRKFKERNLWLECTSVEPVESQALAHALKGARWYDETSCSIELAIPPNITIITLEKLTYNEDGTEIVPINRTFLFRLYINDKPFQDICVVTTNGYGKANSNKIVWEGTTPPTYRIEEIKIDGTDGMTFRNDGPWSGVLTPGTGGKIVVTAKNYLTPNRGWLELDKELLNPTEALKSEKFNFKVEVTGKFSYNGGPMTEYNSANPLVIPVTITGAGKWNSGEFKWYGSAPKYKITEIIPEGATYELVNGKVSNGIGYLVADKTQIATATNKPTDNWTYIQVDKRMVSETEPQPGEEFTFKLKVGGKYFYEGDASDLDNREITLNQGNNWSWKSGRICWLGDKVPTYTISEEKMAEGTSFVSISDEKISSTINDFKSVLNKEKTNVIITNSRAKQMIGKIKILKLAETEDLVGKSFNFNVKVTGEFTYNGEKINGDKDISVSVLVQSVTNSDGKVSYVGETTLGIFSWEKGKAAPKYEVTEVNLPAGSRFVSISNGETTITSSQTITGTLIGVEGDAKDADAKAGQVVITCTNTGTAKKQGHIVIIKESTDESIDDYVFYFKVTITGTFRYYDKINPDGSIGYTQYTNETLVLDGKIEYVEAVCGGEDWVSELIVWDENDPNPTYTVEEISIPANIEFVSISNRTKTSHSTKIDGVLSEGTENNYITAINKPGPNFIDGSIRIVKKGNRHLKGQVFYFDLTVTGEFDYGGKHYGADSELGSTYKLEKIQVEANGNPWVSGIFTWAEGATAPTYTVTEVDIPSGAHFVSISNDKEISTGSISGSLSLTKPVKITAINYDDEIPNGSHIEITKEVLNDKLKGTSFYFNVTVTSNSPFRYHDLEDSTKITYYNAGDVVEFKNVIAVADERDWVSGYFEWDEGAEIPTYTISEITSAFPDKVKSISIRNDTEIIVKELTNTSLEDLVITGSLTGDITHIIAVNDADEDTPVKGKVVIEKRALNEIIKGEEFIYTLKITGKFKYGGKEYRSLEIKDIKITADGPKWISEEIEWYEKDGAPIYTVTEEQATFADGVKFVSIRNAYQTNPEPMITGVVEPHFNNWVMAENTFGGENKGKIQIHKVLLDEKGNQIDGIKFKFKVTVTFADGTTKVDENVEVTSGGYWRSDWYVWSKKDKAPTYKIEEIKDANSKYKCKIDKPEGTIVAQNTEDGVSGIVNVSAQNTWEEEHKAQIRINKNLELNDKIAEEDVTASFQVLVKVIGNFTYKGKAYNNETLTLKVVLNKDSKWTWLSDEIHWNGKIAPTFTAIEPQETIPQGWHLVKTEFKPEDGKLVDGQIAVVDFTNEWKYNEQLLLTMKLAGKVWDDTNRAIDKYADSLENGIIDEDEPGIANVKVTIYRALVNRSDGKVEKRLEGVYAYDENNIPTLIDPVTYTDENGNWHFGAVSVPAFLESEKDQYIDKYTVTYDVEFEYDGQTYEPTEFLATTQGEGGKPKSYVGANSENNLYKDIQNRWSTLLKSSTSERDKYLNDSMAIDKKEDREKFNKEFAEIKGKEPMDDDGNTLGQTGTGKELHYTSVDSVSFFNSDVSRKISTLQTLDDKNYIYEDYLMNAATSNANLTFPFYTTDPNYDVTAWHLRDWDKTLTDEFKITYKFEAIYNYCLSINLGLVEREATDLALEKDLTEAIVVVNGKALKYKFNAAIDLEDPNNSELLYKQLAVADSQIEYKLGLYKGDYYYRAAIYNTNLDVKGKLEGFYSGKLSLPLKALEMEIYLKYTINVYNQSQTFDVTVGEIADYYDASFKLIDKEESRYVQTLNGKTVESVVEMAKPSTVKYLDSGMKETSNGSISWTEVKAYKGSDGVEYKKMTTSSLAGKKLSTGERASITVTFKVDKDAIGESGVKDTIKLGKKHNVAEITKFTSYYSEKSENRWSAPGQISGRVDEDSAPDNVNIENYNEKSYYEDDTDSAPIITISLNDENRAVSGIVWDDAQTQDIGHGQIVGNGLYNPEEGDKLIDGITTEIYETITLPDGAETYKEYQFAWPTEEKLEVLGGHTMSDLTGFHQTVNTENGGYAFVNPPAGNYKVRYIYGDKYIETGKTGSEEIYSGQDYKTTAYQIGFDNDRDNDGYVDNDWHDLSNKKLSDLRVNDARDDEARRIYISAKSEMLTFDNTSLLITADDKTADHTELFGNYQASKDNPVKGEGYYMYAETAKINLGVENIYKLGYTTEKINDIELGEVYGKAIVSGKDVGTPEFTYDVRNVDCGIEERSQTKITLDKQIKQITLMTSDNKVILDAIYDIDYTLKSDGTIAATVILNKDASTAVDHIASLNRRGAHDQGYRYIIAEGTILQGAQIQIKYQLTAFNMSETDRISKDLEVLWSEVNSVATEEEQNAIINNALNKVSSNIYTEDKGRIFEGKSVGYGTYFGSVYYLGSQGVGVRADETIVKTKIHQMIDYIDPDIEFTDLDNISRDQSWSTTDVNYLMSKHLIDPSMVQILDSNGNIQGTAADRTVSAGERYAIISDKLQEYSAENKNNLVLTIDNEVPSDTGSNPSFVKFLEPYVANKNIDRSTGTIALTVSRFYSSELDASDIDNLAEIIHIENTAGRRDARNIAGNANPYKLNEDKEPVGIYAVAQGKEKDASATEVITLSPPTGLNAEESRTMQLIIVILISVTLVAVAIVIIKKKVLVKK